MFSILIRVRVRAHQQTPVAGCTVYTGDYRAQGYAIRRMLQATNYMRQPQLLILTLLYIYMHAHAHTTPAQWRKRESEREKVDKRRKRSRMRNCTRSVLLHAVAIFL